MKDNSSISVSRGLTAFALLVLVIGGALESVALAHRQADKSQKEMDDLDMGIHSSLRAVDSIRYALPTVMTDSMMRNSDYAFVVENQDLIAPMEHIQDSLLQAAVRTAQRGRPMTIVPENETVFRRFLGRNHVLTQRYEFNKKFLDSFYARAAGHAAYARDVRNYFDSVANAQIRTHLNRADSLMIQKRKLIEARNIRNR